MSAILPRANQTAAFGKKGNSGGSGMSALAFGATSRDMITFLLSSSAVSTVVIAGVSSLSQR